MAGNHDRSDEFGRIERFLRPLAAGSPGALDLADDAAFIDIEDAARLVVSADAMVAGVHFLDTEAPGTIARRLLRVNLSDLAGCGAAPFAYLTTLALPKDIGDDWLAEFAAGLGVDQRQFGVGLIGGDMVSTPGPVTLSVTALGRAPAGGGLRRSTAIAGDTVYVSGTIGDAALGLMAMQGGLGGLDEAARAALIGRFQLPTPRIDLGARLDGLAHAAMDISDGLIGDLGHICATSGVGAEIEAARLPLSPAARTVLDDDPGLIATLLTGGDDYELLFTAPGAADAALAGVAAAAETPICAIGRITRGGGVRALAEDGGEIPVGRGGYQHF